MEKPIPDYMEGVEDFHKGYLHPANRKSYALAMIGFGNDLLFSAKHIKDAEILSNFFKNQGNKSIKGQARVFMIEYVMETLIDWIKIIICFENYMKAVLFDRDIVIHKLDRNYQGLNTMARQQVMRPIYITELHREVSPSISIEKQCWIQEGIKVQTLDFSTLLKQKYQEIIELPQSIMETIQNINAFRNNLHFYHNAHNTYSDKFLLEMNELRQFSEDVMMRKYASLIEELEKYPKN